MSKRANERMILAPSAARQGRDLIAEEEAARNEYDLSFTVEMLIAEYAKRRLRERLKTAKRDRTANSAHFGAGDDPQGDGHPPPRSPPNPRRGRRPRLQGEAEKRRSTIQPMFRWALKQDIIEIDPSAGLSPYSQSVARERVLDHDEIRTLWWWLETGDMPSHIADILKLEATPRSQSGRSLWHGSRRA